MFVQRATTKDSCEAKAGEDCERKHCFVCQSTGAIGHVICTLPYLSGGAFDNAFRRTLDSKVAAGCLGSVASSTYHDNYAAYKIDLDMLDD